jgi:hypothetical protein
VIDEVLDAVGLGDDEGEEEEGEEDEDKDEDEEEEEEEEEVGGDSSKQGERGGGKTGAQAAIFTPASDVYALGLVFYAITTGKEPWQRLLKRAQFMPAMTVAQKVVQGARPPISVRDAAQPFLEEQLRACWRQDAAARPTAAQVLLQFIQRTNFAPRVRLHGEPAPGAAAAPAPTPATAPAPAPAPAPAGLPCKRRRDDDGDSDFDREQLALAIKANLAFCGDEMQQNADIAEATAIELAEDTAAERAAHDRGYNVHDVPHDGHCFFHSMAEALTLLLRLDRSAAEVLFETVREMWGQLDPEYVAMAAAHNEDGGYGRETTDPELRAMRYARGLTKLHGSMGTYANEAAVKACARGCKVYIVVHTTGGEYPHGNRAHPHAHVLLHKGHYRYLTARGTADEFAMCQQFHTPEGGLVINSCATPDAVRARASLAALGADIVVAEAEYVARILPAPATAAPAEAVPAGGGAGAGAGPATRAGAATAAAAAPAAAAAAAAAAAKLAQNKAGKQKAVASKGGRKHARRAGNKGAAAAEASSRSRTHAQQNPGQQSQQQQHKKRKVLRDR